MKTTKFFFKKIFSINLVLILVISVIINIVIGSKEVYAAYTQYKKTGIDEFPESYQTYLRQLAELHPNWNFTAFYTGITWDEFMRNESSLGGNLYSHGKNTVINSADVLWKDACGVVKSGYACASPEIIAYFADPRNFLTETGVFQFLEMSYNSEVHTKAGVESIIKNTFMDTSVNITGAEIETAVKAKINGEYILVTPGTTNQEIALTLEMQNYEVRDINNTVISNEEKAITGNTFINIINMPSENSANENTIVDNSMNENNVIENAITGNNTNENSILENTVANNTITKAYTIIVLGDVNGDGIVKSTDYMKIKNYIMGETELADAQKLAADVNNDGQVKSTDYMKIKSYIMGDSTISVKQVENIVNGQISYADIIMKAGEESGISPYSIAIKIIQEVGRQGSNSVHGTYPGYEGYYNFYNIGAYDSGNAIENGLKYAKEKGWDSQYKSIVEGAKYMSDSYINVGQNTAYFYKFDVIDGANSVFWHQYMTNIQDPSSQAKILYNTYAKNELLDLSLNFLIPVYDGMPDVCKLPGAIDASSPTSYYVNGTGVNIRQSPTVNSASVRNAFIK